MNSFANRLKLLREEKELTQRGLAKLLGVAHSTLGMYEIGEREPDYEILTKIATFFDVSTDYLLGQNDIKKNTLPGEIEMKKIPIYSLSNSGEKIFAQKNIIGWQTVSAELMDHVAFLVIDDSMSGSRIYQNDHIVVRKQSHAEDGQIIVVEHDDKIIVRRIKYADNGIILYPDNSEYSPLLVNNNDLRILGVVVQVVFDIN